MKLETEKIYNSLLDAKEELVKSWLRSRGWDGQDRAQARELCKGYKVTQRNTGNGFVFRIEKMTDEEMKAVERGETYSPEVLPD